MEEKEPTVDQILNMMAESLSEKPRPMAPMPKITPETVWRQAL